MRRPLEAMIGELVDGLGGLQMPALCVTDIELALPVETRVRGGEHGPVVLVDMPSTRTRTDFDLPLGRFVLRLAAMPTEGAA